MKMNSTASFWTIGRKLIFGLCSIILVLAVVATVLQIRSARESGYENARIAYGHLTDLLAIQVSGGLKWKKIGSIEKAYLDFADNAQTNLASVITLDNEGVMVTELNSSLQSAFDLGEWAIANGESLKNGDARNVIIGDHVVISSPVVAGKSKDRVGTIVVAWSLARLNSQLDHSFNNQAIGIVVFVVVLIGILAFLSNRLVTRPLTEMTEAMGLIANGDLAAEIPGRHKSDEIGRMAEAVQVFRDNSLEIKTLEEEQEKAKHLAAEQQKTALIALVDTFESDVGGIVEAVASSATELKSTASAMTGISAQTSKQADVVASSSADASENVQSVATAAEQLSASINEISQQVAQSSTITGQAVDEATKANELIRGLDEAAQSIGEVVSLINDIASQTNLLALNATIEAARAGDAGKGFAVVASEVKNLATQTAKATEQISMQIGQVQDATTDAVSAIHNISKTIGEVAEISTVIASAVEEQGAATQKISRSIQQASAGTQEVSAAIHSVTDAATQSGLASQDVLSASGKLAEQSENLREQVSHFVCEVRSA